MRAIIICAGEAKRWGDYLGVPKHLIQINNEPLLHRTVRLLRENGTDEIYIVSKPDPRYWVPGTVQYKPELNYQSNADADKFLSSKSLWSDTGRTVVFYGDVFFTDEAMTTICSYEGREWTLFCRPKGSDYTGTPWGECFAQSFYPEHLRAHEAALHRIARLYKRRLINRCGGWEHYRAMIGLPDNKIRSKIMKENHVVINDFTDDFDYPEDYQRFIERYKVRYTHANFD